MRSPLPGVLQSRRPGRRGQRGLAAAAVAAALGLGALQSAAQGTARAAEAVPSSAQAASFPAGCPWMNTHLSASRRATLLLNASTLDQKLRWLDEQAANNPAQTAFGSVTYPAQVACTPTVVYTDGPDFVRLTKGVTIFPAQLALAASWSTPLAYAKGQAEAAEAFAAGKNVILDRGCSVRGRRWRAVPPSTSARTRCCPATSPPPTSTARRPATPASR
jgi:beta-glucosidase